ncbi:MAG: HAMP domain-containing protein [Candidatus Scalindua sp.]|jgi:two-component system phosphate regulon sensor histidine kinase PhoR|nr:HAMP domain-containing protein [Candidatus Scalindua sp.]MBT6052609.1 HAMP domain-containing protein [Candidatus Scalindua sp.]MBT6562862.1 HAMP domain-containing protein [Candidatus Scalindua sp.]MBT7211696.1 HAMP domain-containing protein [Candidatus Scalindua sp.]MBT7591882.1 HAMP domain-containing protein [Candidatus Scalindua sp.]
MKNSIFIKIFSGYLLIVIVILAITFPLSFRAIRHHHIDTLTGNLKNLCITLKLKISPLLESNQIEDLDTLIKKLGKQIDTRITVISPEGVVFADSEKIPTVMENHKNRIEIIQAIKYGFGTSLRYSASVKEEMLYVAIPIEKDDEVCGVLRASLFLKEINTLLNNLKINIITIAVIIVIILLIGAFLFSRNFSRPLNELGAASRKVAQGDFSTKVFLKSRNEIKELADSFNYMTDQVKTLFTQLSNQKEELNSIISSINEGLCVIDKEGIISISNESFRKTVQNDSVKGKLYWEVLRKARFDELIKKVRSEKNSIVDEIELNNRTFLCSATFCSNKEEIVVTLHDITKIKDLEKTKKDFVTNVSHELRTPLTAIKGFVETLQDTNNDDENQHYLNIIKRHTERVIRIVNDLLLLSELEGNSDSLELENVNLQDLIENILKIFEQRLNEKELVLKFNADRNLPVIKADPFKLEQVFINLVDNAVKYTERGEVVISLSRNNEIVKIEIQDTGICIPREHLSRIFERFYVVDSSRSRKLGGTGLGLSIVKHIVLLHKGKIDVQNIPGTGTNFIVTLPVNLS